MLSLVEIGPQVLEEIFFFFIKVFSLFRSNLLLGRGDLNKLEYQGYFVQSLAEIGPVVLEKKKM